jgi:hypothetical protein
MKKIILFVAVVSAISFTSCKKDHTCTCTTTSTAAGSTAQTQVYTIIDAKKGDAKKMCIDRSEVNGTATETTDCELN